MTTAAEVQEKLEALADAELPVWALREVFPHLRRPFAPAAVRWKVQTEWGSGAVVIAYIDARLVIERLNLVCPTMWETRYEAAPGGAMRCHLTLTEILDTSYGSSGRSITRSDVGVGQGRGEGDKLKAANSDALKRAAVHFGIGVSIYAMKAVTLKVGENDHELRTQKRKKGPQKQEVQVPVIDARTEAALAAGYERWLERTGIGLFGPPLDHGDEAGAAGVDERPAALAADQDAAAEAGDEEAGDGVPQVLDDDRARELRMQAEGWYARLRRVAPRKLLPKAFQAQLVAASGTHVELEAFVNGLEALVAEHEGAAANG